MPRLLLVDDNPSIHKIAETLLARTGIELVCAETAARALDLVRQGEHFDVALLDTAMAGMDGWGLLEELRKLPSTAGIPIAMMAGVLDTVDPDRIQNAPIQGFLKKPVELRDLADRIRKLMETPVEPPPIAEAKPTISPFETMPATRLKDLPELRHLSQQPDSLLEPSSEPETLLVPETPFALPSESLDDLLELTDEDLLIEDESPSMIEEMGTPVMLEEISEESLDLEELDLDSLRELPPPEVQVGTLATPIRLQPLSEGIEDFTPPQGYLASDFHQETSAGSAIPSEVSPLVEESFPGVLVDLPDLGPMDENPFDLDAPSHPDIPQEPDQTSSAVQSELSKVEYEPSLDLTPIPPPLDDFSFDMTEDSDSLLSALEPVDLLETGPSEITDTEILQDEVTESLSIELPEEDLEYLEETLSGIGVEAPATITAHSPLLVMPEEATASGVPAADSTVELMDLAMETEVPETAAPDAVMESGVHPEVPLVQADHAPLPLLLPSQATASQRELLDALMADPVLMEALSKAVVTRLGDKVLREIAWDVIPELVERLPTR